MKIAMFAHFKEYRGNHKHFKSLYDFWGRCLTITDVCMDFEPHFKVYNSVSVHPKSITLCQMTNLNMIFHVLVSVYRFVKIWNSPQFPAEYRNGLFSAASPAEPLRSAGSLAIINCDTIGTCQLKKDKLCTRAMSIEFSHFCLFCWPIIFGGASDHVWMWLSYQRSERMSSQTARMIKDVWFGCHFMPLEKADL